MKIFDGVEVNSTTQSNTSSTQKWLSVLLLVFNAYMSAEQCRQERVAAETEEQGSFEQVMAQAGLKIPGLEQALAQLMGNAEEAKIAASMIAGSPDPLDLLERLARRFGADAVANTVATNTAAPARRTDKVVPPGVVSGSQTNLSPESASARASEPSAPASPIAAPASGPAEPAPRSAGGTLDSPPPNVGLLWDRPDFAELAREVARAADAAGSSGAAPPPLLPKFLSDPARAPANEIRSTPLPKFRPDFVPEAPEAVQAASSPLSSASTCPPLLGVVKRQLEALRRRMDAWEAELGDRLGKVEVELAALRDDLRQRSRPTLVVVPPSGDDVDASPASAEQPSSEATRGDVEVGAGQPVAIVGMGTRDAPPSEAVDRITRGARPPLGLPGSVTLSQGAETQRHIAEQEHAERIEEVASQPAGSGADLPLSATDDDVAQTLDLIAELDAEVVARYQRGLARIGAVEHEALLMRAELCGEVTEPAMERALS